MAPAILSFDLVAFEFIVSFVRFPWSSIYWNCTPLTDLGFPLSFFWLHTSLLS
ncbi:hypothetical protein BGZ60DRAFT_410136 [Tricladium varicosporioides]|nr:hypothetical protein BGZ60DRAFT_410136 [Hymenoscyphus varicosporioides]